METVERTSVGWPTRCRYDSRVMCKRQFCFSLEDVCPHHPIAKQILSPHRACQAWASQLEELMNLVEIQGEILFSMSREGAGSPEALEIQCALSRERGINLSKIWKLRGDLDQ